MYMNRVVRYVIEKPGKNSFTIVGFGGRIANYLAEGFDILMV